MIYKDNFNLWNNYISLDKELKNEMLIMSEEELKDAFHTNLKFGTAGIRGIIGAGTNRINKYIVKKVTLGFANYLIEANKDIKKGVCIAYDNRHMSKEFAMETSEVLMALGFKVYLFKDLRPTPQLSFTIRHLNCIGGIMITASHNPKEYNGYKIYNEQGAQFLPNEATLVVQHIDRIKDYFNINKVYDENLITLLDENEDIIYLENIKDVRINKDLRKDFKIIYTPLHGTGKVFIKELLEDVGYNVLCVKEQMTADSDFTFAKSSNPEDKEAYELGIKLAKANNAKIIFATDPDSDRMGVAVLHNDEYHILTGNEIGILLFNYIVSSKKKIKELKENSYMFLSLVSSNLPIKIAEKNNVKYDITLTGFKWIANKIENVIKDNNHFIFAFEESNGYLLKESVRDKDAIQAILLMSEIVSYYNTSKKTLVDALDDIYKEYGYYLNDITNINLSFENGPLKIKEIMNYFANENLNLNNFKIVAKDDLSISKRTDYVNNIEKEIMLPKSDVIKFYLENDSWFTLRPSGTEPKFKVYYGIKGETKEESKRLLESLKEEVIRIIDNI